MLSPRQRRFALGMCLLLALAAPSVLGQTPPPPNRTPDSREPSLDPSSVLPAECDIEFRELKWAGDDEAELFGPVTILCGDERLQADYMRVSGRNKLVGEGNVLLVWQGSRIFGSRMEYDLETGTGFIEDAIGSAMDEYLFWAAKAEKRGPKTVYVEKATVTTCTQPTPYWSFAVSSATITIDNYARMWNVRLKTGGVPIVYLPYLIWPVKQERAAGLLFPEFGSTRVQGDTVTQELFIPLGRSADVTLLGRYYTRAGFGAGLRANVLPTQKGQAVFDGFFIRDRTRGLEERFRATFRQTQEFRNGFKLFADMNFVSDFDYFTDFERDLTLVTSPTILAKIEMARNGRWASLNVRELRREQFLGRDANGNELTLVQQTLPEIEWRGRSRRLGRSPFYLSFETSLTRIQLDGTQAGDPIDTKYFRGDLFPTITAPWSPTSWLDIEPLVTYRLTHYTRSQRLVTENGTTRREVRSDDITRDLWEVGLRVIGPKFSKIYDRGNREGKTQFKHVIEPQISYGAQDAFDRDDDLLVYDELDRIVTAGETVSYSIVQRLFSRKPRKKPEKAPSRDLVLQNPRQPANGPRQEVNPFTTFLPEETPEEEQDEEAPAEPVEIASFQLSQSRSLDEERTVDFDLDGTIDRRTPFSNVAISGRYSPSNNLNLDVRGTYDTLFEKFSSASLSGGFRKKLARMTFSAVHRNGLRATDDDNTQFVTTTGFTLLGGRLALELDATFRLDPPEGQKAFPTRSWRVRYATQCCTIYVEQFQRDFTDFSDRRDLFLKVDFTGIGRIFKVNY